MSQSSESVRQEKWFARDLKEKFWEIHFYFIANFKHQFFKHRAQVYKKLFYNLSTKDISQYIEPQKVILFTIFTPKSCQTTKKSSAVIKLKFKFRNFFHSP
jgi:hypothetical protein